MVCGKAGSWFNFSTLPTVVRSPFVDIVGILLIEGVFEQLSLIQVELFLGLRS
jgi:hypothetical protein